MRDLGSSILSEEIRMILIRKRIFLEDCGNTMLVVALGRHITRDLEAMIGFPVAQEYKRAVHLGIRKLEMKCEKGCGHLGPLPF